MINPTISSELLQERQTQLRREAELDRLARESAESARGLDQRVMLPVADALVALGHRIQRHYGGEPARGLVLAADARQPASADDWLAFLARNVRPGGTFLLIHMTDRGVSGFTCWGELSAPGAFGPSGGTAGPRFAPQQP